MQIGLRERESVWVLAGVAFGERGFRFDKDRSLHVTNYSGSTQFIGVFTVHPVIVYNRPSPATSQIAVGRIGTLRL